MENQRKRILICEDDLGMAFNLSDMFEDKGFSCEILAEHLNPDYVVKNILESVRKEPPTYAVVDGLDSKCYEVVDLITRNSPETISVIYSGDIKIIDEAERRGYQSIKKPNLDVLLNLIKL